MGYYSVLILLRMDRDGFEYEYSVVYFNGSENMMRVRLYDAIREAQGRPNADYVTVWYDGQQLLKVKIEH